MVKVEGLERALREHPFFEGMNEAYRDLVAGCAANEVFHAGEYIYKEGRPADKFYLIRHGRVALEVHVPGKESIVVETLKGDDLMGWSWLVPPYRANFDARALELTRVVSLDAKCLRGKMEQDAALGYELHKRFAPIVAARLAAARRQLIDMYGHPDE
jgi:CRP-like cAMP-binding protein